MQATVSYLTRLDLSSLEAGEPEEATAAAGEHGLLDATD